MITVITYGRNDAHGYNLHRRAALSLNCLAEVLSEPDDEIVFVDYNTPDELPTLIEALGDTLTDRCLERLRVLRVRAATHARRFAARTHLPAVEPVARNAAVRRANPSNRWLLSTNTDMILLPLSNQSLSEICAHLPDGFYGLPRFELPEWLWEHVPRSDPSRAISEIASLGPGLRLDEPTLNHEWIRFDAPGDFQLMLREDFLAIDGFDEEMLLGWHVDSNLSRRMFLHRGAIESLEGQVAGYHCNHSRTPTVYHGAKWIANDMSRFFFSVDRADLPAQRTTWGLADLQLEEVTPLGCARATFMAALTAATEAAPASRTTSDVRTAEFGLAYDSAHVLPFVADSVAVAPPGTTIGYIGTNPVLEQMLAVLVGELDRGNSFVAAKLEDRESIFEFARAADLLVIDLGVDASLIDDKTFADDGHGSGKVPSGLQLTFDAFQRLVELERARLDAGEHERRFVLVNSSAAYWNAYVLAELDCSHTTAHSRVRRATVKARPDDVAIKQGLQNVRQHVRWAERDESDTRRLHLRVGESIAIAELESFGGFGQGWADPDRSAIWTQGPRADLAIALDGASARPCFLTLAFDRIGVRNDAPLRVDLLVNGAHVATRDFTRVLAHRRRQGLHATRGISRPILRRPAASLRRRARALCIQDAGVPTGVAGKLLVRGLGLSARLRRHVQRLSVPGGDPTLRWRVTLPAHEVADGKADLTLAIAEPVSWSDARRLGLHLVSLAVRTQGRVVNLVGLVPGRHKLAEPPKVDPNAAGGVSIPASHRPSCDS